ncbi:uncharacterized protein isoform X1 [Musca autumnalis]|uniref:uncharacterized protein isoform X1 n=1 Tax=Musca autumnalis TaxID=221902 RepID=UPI003CEB9877
MPMPPPLVRAPALPVNAYTPNVYRPYVVRNNINNYNSHSKMYPLQNYDGNVYNNYNGYVQMSHHDKLPPTPYESITNPYKIPAVMEYTAEQALATPLTTSSTSTSTTTTTTPPPTTTTTTTTPPPTTTLATTTTTDNPTMYPNQLKEDEEAELLAAFNAIRELDNRKNDVLTSCPYDPTPLQMLNNAPYGYYSPNIPQHMSGLSYT